MNGTHENLRFLWISCRLLTSHNYTLNKFSIYNTEYILFVPRKSLINFVGFADFFRREHKVFNCWLVALNSNFSISSNLCRLNQTSDSQNISSSLLKERDEDNFKRYVIPRLLFKHHIGFPNLLITVIVTQRNWITQDKPLAQLPC